MNSPLTNRRMSSYWCNYCGDLDKPFKVKKGIVVCPRCVKEENMKKKLAEKAKQPLVDKYTEEILRDNYTTYKHYYESRMNTKKIVSSRMPNMPEDISENIVKFIIRNHVGVESYWARSLEVTGDLWSPVEKVQECKCFMSDGPSSFGPIKNWNVIYFLDARKWTDDVFTLYRCEINPEDEIWKNMKCSGPRSKKAPGTGEKWQQMCDRGARPHISWKGIIEPQLGHLCKKVYEGSFEGIFTPATVPVSQPVE